MRILTALSLALFVAACGSSSSSSVEEPFSFLATGLVASIEDGLTAEALHPNVQVGDSYTMRLDYDPTRFTDAGPAGGGREYAAHEGARIIYFFESGYVVERPLGSVRVRENGGMGQWNWKGPKGELWFQANESVGSTFGGVFPEDFTLVHDMFVEGHTDFAPSSGNTLRESADDLEDERVIGFSDQEMVVVANDG